MADDEAPKYIKVKYAANANPLNGSERIELPGRPDIDIGGTGEVTEEELANLRTAGLVMEPVVDPTKPIAHVHGDVTHEHPIDFDGMSSAKLDEALRAHPDVTPTGTGAQGKVLSGDKSGALAEAHGITNTTGAETK